MAEPQTTNGYISRGNMSIILVAAGLIMGGFGWVTNNQNNVLNGRIDELRETAKHAISRGEHDEFKLRLDRDIGLIRDEQQRRGGSIVPRTEHEARWASTSKDLALLSERLNELRNATSSTYTIRDEVHRMQTEVSEMRKLLSDRSGTK